MLAVRGKRRKSNRNNGAGWAVRRDMMRLAVLSFALVAVVVVFSPHANAASSPLFRGQQAVGKVGIYVTGDEDTLLDVARNNDLGYGQLVAVNPGVDPGFRAPGRRVNLPQRLSRAGRTPPGYRHQSL